MRNIAKERARAAANRPTLERQYFELLTSRLPPRFHHPLIGQDAILTFLHSLGARRPNGHRITWTQVKRWRRTQRFPLRSGYTNVTGRRYAAPPFTTDHAIVAWLLALDPLSLTFLSVHSPHAGQAKTGSFPPSVAAAG